jgi:hypothetical protein
MSAEQIAQTLSYSVKVNRVRIPDGEFLVNVEKLTDFLSPTPKAKPPPPKPVVVKRKATFQAISVKNIDRFTGSRIRIKQRSGKTTEGFLTATEKHRIDIDVPQAQGKVLVHLDKFDIAGLWILSDKNLSRFTPAVAEVAPEAEPRETPKASREEEIDDILSNIDKDNATIIYEEGTDINTPLAEGEYFEIIEIEEAEAIANPTINDLPAITPSPDSVNNPSRSAPAKAE